MNSEYEIYYKENEDIPLEDKARLDGYLKGRADSHQQDKLNEMKKKFENLRRKKIK